MRCRQDSRFTASYRTESTIVIRLEIGLKILVSVVRFRPGPPKSKALVSDNGGFLHSGIGFVSGLLDGDDARSDIFSTVRFRPLPCANWSNLSPMAFLFWADFGSSRGCTANLCMMRALSQNAHQCGNRRLTRSADPQPCPPHFALTLLRSLRVKLLPFRRASPQ